MVIRRFTRGRRKSAGRQVQWNMCSWLGGGVHFNEFRHPHPVSETDFNISVSHVADWHEQMPLITWVNQATRKHKELLGPFGSKTEPTFHIGWKFQFLLSSNDDYFCWAQLDESALATRLPWDHELRDLVLANRPVLIPDRKLVAGTQQVTLFIVARH